MKNRNNRAFDLTPPSGVKYILKDNYLRVQVKFHLAIRIIIAFLWVASIVISILAICDIDLYTVPTSDFPTYVHVLFNAVMSGFALYFLLSTLSIEVDPDDVRIVYLPWHFPPSIKEKTSDLRDVNIDVKVTKNKNGNEHYSYTVTLSLASKYYTPKIFATSNEPQAIFVRNILTEFLVARKG